MIVSKGVREGVWFGRKDGAWKEVMERGMTGLWVSGGQEEGE